MLKKLKFAGKLAAVLLLVVLLLAAGCFGVWKYLGKGWFDDRALLRENPVAEIYTESYQEEVQKEIDQLKAERYYPPEEPLLLVNPYGTNTTGLYIWFETRDAFTVSYTIHADGYPDFSRTLSSEPTTEHEYQIIGMVPTALNTITLELTDSAGGVSSFSFEQQAPALLRGESFTTLEVTEGTSTQELGDTLYTMLGPQEKATFTYQPYTCAYDAAGVARMEIPLVNYRTERQTFANDLMYYNISYNTIVGVNSLGKMVERFDLNHYSMHHDYTLGGDNDLLVLATRDDEITTEDRIVRVDLESGKVSQLVDLSELFSEYVAQLDNPLAENKLERFLQWTQLKSYSAMNWIHINSIELLGTDSLLLSSRETSTIIKIDNIYDEPTVDYLIGSPNFWEGSGYEDLLLTQIGEFSLQAGQHALSVQTDDSLPDGQYYVTLFNNNNAICWGRSYDFSADPCYWDTGYDWFEDAIGNAGTPELNSYYYKYLVDENAGTFSLVESIPVSYSGYISSVEDIGSTKVICSGIATETVILDENNELIQSMTSDYDYWWYRVFGYDYSGFWFA